MCQIKNSYGITIKSILLFNNVAKMSSLKILSYANIKYRIPLLEVLEVNNIEIMDFQEEQQQEIEVLESIYPDELEKLSETHFTIKISLDTETQRRHKLLLDVKYPETYPEVVPNLHIEIVEDEDEDEEDEENSDDDLDNEDTNRMLNLAETVSFVREDITSLLMKLNEEAEMQVGMPSVFALVTLLKDEAEILFQAKVDSEQKKYDEELAKRDAEEQKKFNGTPVTKETWAAWRESFRKEMNYEEKDLQAYRELHQGKLTGKEIFERGLAGNDEDELLNEVTEGVKKTTV